MARKQRFDVSRILETSKRHGLCSREYDIKTQNINSAKSSFCLCETSEDNQRTRPPAFSTAHGPYVKELRLTPFNLILEVKILQLTLSLRQSDTSLPSCDVANCRSSSLELIVNCVSVDFWYQLSKSRPRFFFRT